MHRPVLQRPCLLVAALSSLLASWLLLDVSHAEAPAGKKHALIIGIREFDSSRLDPLRYTENDAEELASVLTKEGRFDTIRVLTTTRGTSRPGDAPNAANIRAAIKVLLAGKTRTDTLLVGLAGHGVSLRVTGKGGNEREESFFCPSDAQLNDHATLISLKQLFADLDGCGAAVKLLLVDACRNDPTIGRNANADYLRPPRGIAALFSCKSGERAFESPKLGRGHGVFFHHVIQGLRGKAKNERGEVTWSRLADYVIDAVSEDVPKIIGEGAKQTPEQKLNLTGRSPVLVTQGQVPTVSESSQDIVNSVGMKLRLIPKGKFSMGSNPPEKGRLADEHAHVVTISRPFYVGVYEVTQGEYRKVMGKNPSWFSPEGGGKASALGQNTDSFPVENVSWHDAVAFCEKLSALDRSEKGVERLYRLPTEAEWEYACRGAANVKDAVPFNVGAKLGAGDAAFDWRYPYGGGTPQTRKNADHTFPVGSHGHNNRFGLYDMHGNVWEWCADWYGRDYYRKSAPQDPPGPERGTLRVLRGGAFFSTAQDCRSARRGWHAPDHRASYLGFRVVCSPGVLR
jgi:formylglycine-generating enzyme required for sulfatase activity